MIDLKTSEEHVTSNDVTKPEKATFPDSLIKIEELEELRNTMTPHSEANPHNAINAYAGRKLRGRGFALDEMPKGEEILREMHVWPSCDSETAPTPTMVANKYGE